MLKKLMLGGVAALFVVGAAAVAQQWLPYPQVGGSSFCSSTVNTSCVNTVPAGPALTGKETVPADTNASGGQSPQTVKIALTSLGAGPYQYVTGNDALTAGGVVANAATRYVILNPAGTIATYGVQFPGPTSALVDGQRFGFCSTQIVTALTLTAGGTATINGAPTAAVVPVTTGNASCPEWIYVSSVTTWFRIH